MKLQQQESNGGSAGENPQPGPIATITVDNKPVEIHRGRRTVGEIKAAGGVPQAFELSEVVKGKLTPLPDDGAVTIKGGEVFVSNPRSSGSS